MGRVIRVLVGAYREWALATAYRALTQTERIGFDGSATVCKTPDELARTYLAHNEAGQWPPFDLALLIGWSWIVPSAMVQDLPCVCLHPSPLPRYRGGSPLQHQIIAGETESAITLFRMTNELDAGPIYAQAPLSLAGSLGDIFERIKRDAPPMLAAVVGDIARGTANPVEQDHTQATVFRRRTPEESEIRAEHLGFDAHQIHDKIRALAHPDYPNAFIRDNFGNRVYLTGSRFEEKEGIE